MENIEQTKSKAYIDLIFENGRENAVDGGWKVGSGEEVRKIKQGKREKR